MDWSAVANVFSKLFYDICHQTIYLRYCVVSCLYCIDNLVLEIISSSGLMKLLRIMPLANFINIFPFLSQDHSWKKTSINLGIFHASHCSSFVSQCCHWSFSFLFIHFSVLILTFCSLTNNFLLSVKCFLTRK